MNFRNIITSAHGTLVAGIIALAAVSPAQAAPISWGAATNITGDTDVSTNGVLVAAYNINGADTTVNTVSFETLNVGSVTDTSSGTAPFTGLSAAYQDLLGTAFSSSSDFELGIVGLTVGQLYEFQVWSNNSADEFHYGVKVGDSASFSNSVLLSSGSGPLDNYLLGQYVIGTFTADVDSQTIYFSPDEVANVNGFQLRAIYAAVPEPDAILIFGTGLTGLAVSRFRRRKPK